MNNLEQIRAANALAFSKEGSVSGRDKGEVIKKIPPLIMNHGLLNTAAYSYAEKNEGWQKVFDAIARHLASPQIEILPIAVHDRHSLMEYLANVANSQTLKLATTETMAWLQYARRFVKKSEGGDE